MGRKRPSHGNDNSEHRRERRNPTIRNDDDEPDILELHTDEEWLTNQVQAEARNSKSNKRSDKKYDSIDVCRIGLERILGITRDDSFESVPLSVVENQIYLCNMYYQRFFELTVHANPMSAKEIVAQQKLTDKFDDLYSNLNVILEHRRKLLIEEQACASQNSSEVTQSTMHSTESNIHHEIKVKRVEIEKFSGDNKKWPQFKSSFEECFHRRTDISGASKFYHLMAHLEENSEAYLTVSGIDRTDANYSSAWKMLCDAYDNERKIVNDIVLSFIDMPSCNERPNRAELIALINRTNNLIQSLPKYGIEVQHWDPILVPLLIRKLDGESIRLWSLERDQRTIASIQPLLEFIRKRADGMDAEFVIQSDNNNRSYVSRNQHSNNNSSFVSKRPHFRGPEKPLTTTEHSNGTDSAYSHDPSLVKKRRANCYHCFGAHQLYNCESFGRMSDELKEDRLKKLGLCVKCLRKGHALDQCTLSNCRNCGQPHNRVLCKQNKSTSAILSVMHSEPTVKNIDAAH